MRAAPTSVRWSSAGCSAFQRPAGGAPVPLLPPQPEMAAEAAIAAARTRLTPPGYRRLLTPIGVSSAAVFRFAGEGSMRNGTLPAVAISIALFAGAAPALGASYPDTHVLSTRPGLVSGGDALVQVVPQPGARTSALR